ncbi:RNA 5'-monophosphate methyltransferase isoform X2 [Manacus candei]|uniref:RNA 5'-monophosphate methyltransferase isoform X2 n=1 Tax=Manacus candei TaxID=415023 RepID=UPI002225F296|nr:RNA 5'-monophosphate methyltransferase isoform X2 [Manacus candei]XP_051624839.1 RNA 5'-monophosphate methyltransferase isoform X2 [Manacus candei]XP_051624840.1 RNA 5'-monophosphate methyltransferase isoform X2 [Manacus candei]XP_051624841.1 RNA 5'-monophosphate methyltransferase isoform X2 [Manacus candei]
MAAPTGGGSRGPDPGGGARGLDPGAAPYGNFPNYSRFHPPEGRVRLVPPGLLQTLFPEGPRPLLALDVGCNSGELSLALYRRLLGLPEGDSRPAPGAAGAELNLLCCDIDAELIRRARRGCPFPDSVSFVPLDIMDPGSREPLLRSHLQRFGRSRFDLVSCLSVTMWIHLRHGDGGLREFLAFLASRGSVLLLEPQPWKCYRAAARRLRRAGRADFEHFRSLGIRGDVEGGISRILTRDCAMESLGCLGSTDWRRSLLLFRASRERAPERPLGAGEAEGESRNS